MYKEKESKAKKEKEKEERKKARDKKQETKLLPGEKKKQENSKEKRKTAKHPLIKQGLEESKMKKTLFERDPVNPLKNDHKEPLDWNLDKTWNNWYVMVILMRAALMKVITTFGLIVRILVTNVESASL